MTLNVLGVGDRVANEAAPAGPHVSRHFQTGEVLRPGQETIYVERFGAAYHQLHRVDLHAALACAVRRNDPDCVLLGHCFEVLGQDSEELVVKFTNGKTFTSDVLIGGASKLRAWVFGDEVMNYTGQVAIRAILPMANVPAIIQEHPFAMFGGVNRFLLHYPLRHRTIMNVIAVGRELRWQEDRRKDGGLPPR